MNSIAPSHLQQEPPFTWWLCQLRFYQALISCANHRLNAQQGPRLKDDVPAAVATNRCVGYEIAMMDERWIFIENKADTMDHEELAPIKSGIDRQAEELKGKRQQFVKDTEKRWPPPWNSCAGLPGSTSPTASPNRSRPPSRKSTTNPPRRPRTCAGRNRRTGRCADGGAALRTRRVHGQVPGIRRPGPRHNQSHPHREWGPIERAVQICRSLTLAT